MPHRCCLLACLPQIKDGDAVLVYVRMRKSTSEDSAAAKSAAVTAGAAIRSTRSALVAAEEGLVAAKGHRAAAGRIKGGPALVSRWAAAHSSRNLFPAVRDTKSLQPAFEPQCSRLCWAIPLLIANFRKNELGAYAGGAPLLGRRSPLSSLSILFIFLARSSSPSRPLLTSIYLPKKNKNNRFLF